MVNVGKRLGDSKKKKEVKQITFFNDPNDSVIPDPIQQFDILTGVEKEKKLRPKVDKKKPKDEMRKGKR